MSDKHRQQTSAKEARMSDEDYDKIIEELEEQNKRLRLEVAHANDTADAAIERVKELEAKLAEVTDVALRLYYGAGVVSEDMHATLAELSSVSCANTTGGKDE